MNVKYMNKFLNLKCSGDVINAISPIGHEPAKEITESMGLIKKFKGLLIANPGKYNILDLCAGNALTSVLASHLFKLDYANAIDKKSRNRRWELVNSFNYIVGDIYQDEIKHYVNNNTIIISVHACGNLAKRIIEIYKMTDAKALVLMPCCLARLERKYPEEIEKRLGHYLLFCWDLMQELENSTLVVDNSILSPKNVIIKALR
jgi:hypothetical protein